MEILFRLLMLLLMAFTGVGQTQTTPPPMTPTPTPQLEMRRAPLHIESVLAQTTRSLPAQINLIVRGSHDGCDFPVQVEQRRDGNTITVDIYRDMPLETMCPMMLVYYDDTIHLDGTFESGTYTIIVNDVQVEVTI